MGRIRSIELARELLRSAFDATDARTPEERKAHGAELRENVPLNTHALWNAPEDRPDPVALLKSQGESRVQALLPLRYERMSASAFTFYRGGALIMASDLNNTPSSGIEVQACGDAHISNFGLFSSPERRTVFDINDFDETARGPWEWDVKRLATSVEICCRDRGFDKKQAKRITRLCVRSYREAMAQFAQMGHLEVWYAHLDVDTLMGVFADKTTKANRKQAEKIVSKAKAKNSARAIMKLTEVVDGELRIVSDPPIVVPMRDMAAKEGRNGDFTAEDMEKLVRLALAGYRRTLPLDKRRLVQLYRGVDIAHKVVGVGSVGTRALIVVMQGASSDDHLVLQIKEAQESVLERFCGKSEFSHHGERVVEGQRAIQTASDMLLGWCSLPDPSGKMKDYYVRQLWDGKGSIDLTVIDEERLERLASVAGWTLAHAHARTGDRFEIAGYLGEDDTFDKAVAKFARAYANQNEADYARFMQALDDGELPRNDAENAE
ncbi:MAG: DUF2252 domain-containing protein [Coriobacteriia bacterium]|nr:DUF2252 domain-containing protein [Coriobacteriia bacterium]